VAGAKLLGQLRIAVAKFDHLFPAMTITLPIFSPFRRRRVMLLATVLIFLTIVFSYGRLISPATYNMENFRPASPPESNPPPKVEDEKKEPEISYADLPMSYGVTARPPFKDLLHMAELPEKFVPSPVNDRRLVIIGDVHGMLPELKALLGKVGYNERSDHIIFTGDLINKGPDSAGVVEFAIEKGASSVRGNHEDRVLLVKDAMMSRYVADGIDGTGSQGDDTTTDTLEQEVFSHGDYAERSTARSLSREHIQWLASRPVILRVGNLGTTLGEMVVVHAGLVPGVELAKQDPWAVMNMRTLAYPREELRRAEAKTYVEEAWKDRASRSGRPMPNEVPESLVEREYRRRKKDTDRGIAIPINSREGENWAKQWNAHMETLDPSARTTVVFGHDAKTGLQTGSYTFGLDSGCVKGNKLSAMIVEGGNGRIKHRIVQINCKAPKKVLSEEH
jgi:bis(5'-nucleosyl)-tetraphosphatase (symmetrical)